MVIFFDLLLALRVAATLWFVGYVLYRLVTDGAESPVSGTRIGAVRSMDAPPQLDSHLEPPPRRFLAAPPLWSTTCSVRNTPVSGTPMCGEPVF
ncbi:hypothetical protein FCG67_18825 [Rhodococcus oryzae]|uniref:MAPEG family protein n=1 Tax=Rhodococcus oryzae TaxID=2571143 RepID=A0ABY2RGL2_9NOCA|nr:hypothetical protein FCG67_18825 [Rhodococcus oryzae]